MEKKKETEKWLCSIDEIKSRIHSIIDIAVKREIDIEIKFALTSGRINIYVPNRTAYVSGLTPYSLEFNLYYFHSQKRIDDTLNELLFFVNDNRLLSFKVE